MPRTAASIVWEHFTVEQQPDGKQTATCNFCKRAHAVNVTRLRQHLIDDCPDCPTETKEALQDDPGKYQRANRVEGVPTMTPQLPEQISQPQQIIPNQVLAPEYNAPVVQRPNRLPDKLFGKDVPIPPRPDGFRYSGTSSSWIQMEIFVDPVCPYSKGAWLHMKSVAMHYRDKVSILVHMFPLPYHNNSYYICQIGTTLGKEHTRAFFIWLEHIFTNQESLTNKATSSYSRAQVAAMLVQMGAEIGLGEERISHALTDPASDHGARVSWKYGCTRGVSGTPMFLVNGVMVTGCATWDLRKWRQLLDPLLGISTS
eukprot:comp19655_c0_seq1/m.23266 comp19655_c0_seq1/g.23266  ORF comp19655_c0_seq1/g.23266 comp19655_c0_seq1/m.23266 type:complete len:314 (-) comp19655_c0_seq1:383-1324(-)